MCRMRFGFPQLFNELEQEEEEKQGDSKSLGPPPKKKEERGAVRCTVAQSVLGACCVGA